MPRKCGSAANICRRYDLREAPPGYRWVIVDEDAYLTQVATGLVAEAVIDLLN